MGSCVSCPGRERHDEYVFYHQGTDECIIGSNKQLYDRRNAEVLADINEFETVILNRIQRRPDIGYIRTGIDSGYKSVYSDRLSPEPEELIQQNHLYLLENLMANCPLPRLVQDGILSPDDKTEILNEVKEEDKAELLIQKLIHSKPESFATFVDVLRKTNKESIAFALEAHKKAQEDSQETPPGATSKHLNAPGPEMCIVIDLHSPRLNQMTLYTSGIDAICEDTFTASKPDIVKCNYLDRLSPEHEKMIQRNYQFLLDNLMAECLTPRLVQDGILSPDDDLEIRKVSSERAKAELLIQKLVHSKPGSFATFLDVLRDTDQAFIARALEKDEKAQEEFPEVWTAGDEAKIKRMIQQKESYLLDELDPDKILGFFVEQEIFDIESIADMTFKSRRDKSRTVLNSVLQNLPYAFNLLLYALKQTKSAQLANRLGEWVSSTIDDSNLGNESPNWRHRGSLRYDSKGSKVMIQMKITLSGGENGQPLHKLEACVLERINSEKRDNVEEKLFKEAESVFKNATKGSLTIHMTPCSKRTYAKLVDFCQHGSFKNLLKNLLSDQKTTQLLPKGPLTVKIQLLANGVIEECRRSDVAKFRDRLIEEFDTVVDEINPMNFERPFIDRRLLSEEYFHQLGQSFAQSRSARATDFVKKVLELGEDAVLAFMETITKKGPEYLLGILKRDSTTKVDVHDEDELIAQLEVRQHESTDSNEITFYDTSFRIIIHNPVDSHGTQPIGPAIRLNTPGTEMYNVTDVPTPRLGRTTFGTSGTYKIRVDKAKALEPDITECDKPPRSSDTSDYTSLYSFRNSYDTDISRLSMPDPALDLEADLKN